MIIHIYVYIIFLIKGFIYPYTKYEIWTLNTLLLMLISINIKIVNRRMLETVMNKIRAYF